MQNIIRLPLDNAYNVRELGGYYTKDKQITQWHRFLRSDDISQLTNQDIQFLLNYGVNSVIDLRSQSECQAHPDSLMNIEGIDYYHLPFMSGDIDDVTKIMDNLEQFDLGDFYVELLKEKELVAQLLSLITDAKEGCLLFHCSAGKDRTGILSMLLLMIAGVSNVDIEANYQLTYTYLKEKPGLLDMMPSDMDLSCMYSKPETIRKAIDYILDHYQDIETYLMNCGLSS
ncbi:tyrosine-protein phosphatase, partial [Coprobacillus cateniformis]|nr:tyrosine-protein phosphatase [Coprobacillus cateniformis]